MRGLPAAKVLSDSSPDRRWFSVPFGIRYSAIRVRVVVGPPGSGKSTYVRKHAKPHDTIIDMDDIRQRLGFSRYSPDPSHIRQALAERDRMIASLCSRWRGEAWLIVMAPTRAERIKWLTVLGDLATVHEMAVEPDECKRRILADPTRAGAEGRLIEAVDRWFSDRAAG